MVLRILGRHFFTLKKRLKKTLKKLYGHVPAEGNIILGHLT